MFTDMCTDMHWYRRARDRRARDGGPGIDELGGELPSMPGDEGLWQVPGGPQAASHDAAP